MDKFVKEFIDYLMYIGFVNSNSISLFIGAFNSILDKAKGNEQESPIPLINSSLVFYLNNLSPENKRQISSSLISKFIENKEKIRLNALQSLVLAKTLRTKQRYISKWAMTAFAKWPPSEMTDKAQQRAGKKGTVCSGPSDFFLRQQQFTQQLKKQHVARVLRSEDEFSLICPFSPTLLTSNYIKSKESPYCSGKDAYVRLYNDSRRRTEAISKRQCDSSKPNKSSTNQSRPNNKSANEKMFNYYKIYKNKKALLQKEVDKERGITFKPKLKSSQGEDKPLSSYQLRKYYEVVRTDNNDEDNQ